MEQFDNRSIKMSFNEKREKAAIAQLKNERLPMASPLIVNDELNVMDDENVPVAVVANAEVSDAHFEIESEQVDENDDQRSDLSDANSERVNVGDVEYMNISDVESEQSEQFSEGFYERIDTSEDESIDLNECDNEHLELSDMEPVLDSDSQGSSEWSDDESAQFNDNDGSDDSIPWGDVDCLEFIESDTQDTNTSEDESVHSNNVYVNIDSSNVESVHSNDGYDANIDRSNDNSVQFTQRGYENMVLNDVESEQSNEYDNLSVHRNDDESVQFIESSYERMVINDFKSELPNERGDVNVEFVQPNEDNSESNDKDDVGVKQSVEDDDEEEDREDNYEDDADSEYSTGDYDEGNDKDDKDGDTAKSGNYAEDADEANDRDDNNRDDTNSGRCVEDSDKNNNRGNVDTGSFVEDADEANDRDDNKRDDTNSGRCVEDSDKNNNRGDIDTGSFDEANDRDDNNRDDTNSGRCAKDVNENNNRGDVDSYFPNNKIEEIVSRFSFCSKVAYYTNHELITYSINNWIDYVAEAMIETYIVRVPDKLLEILFESADFHPNILQQPPFQSFFAEVRSYMEYIGKGVFIRNNWRSAVDSYLSSKNYDLKVTDINEMLSVVSHSNYFMEEYKRSKGIIPYCIVIRPWIPIMPRYMFRGIVVHGCLVGITPKQTRIYIPCFINTYIIASFKISQMFDQHLHKFPEKHYVFDAIIHDQIEMNILWDISPLNRKTELYAFSWEEIKVMIEQPPVPRDTKFCYTSRFF